MSAVVALLVGLTSSYAVPVGTVMGITGFGPAVAACILATNIAVAVIGALAGVLVATVIDDHTRGLGFLLLAWFLASVVYDALLLCLIVILEEYPIDGAIAAAVLVNPVDGAGLLHYQYLGLGFLLPVTLPPAVVWSVFVFWSVLLFSVAFRCSLQKDY